MYRYIILVLIGLVCVGVTSCRSDKVQEMTERKCQIKTSSPLCGSWVQYLPDGEWGEALEVYDFSPNGNYRIIIGVLPEGGRKDALPTALSMTGQYVLKEDTIVFTSDDGVEKNRRFEIRGECLFIKGEKDKISILRRVTGSDDKGVSFIN